MIIYTVPGCCIGFGILIQELAKSLSSYSETAFLQLARPTGMITLRGQKDDFEPPFRYSRIVIQRLANFCASPNNRYSYSETTFLQLVRPTANEVSTSEARGTITLSDQRSNFVDILPFA
jgi:hypothetical protein